MFGYWKREAKVWWDVAHKAMDQRDKLIKANRALNVEKAELQAERDFYKPWCDEFRRQASTALLELREARGKLAKAEAEGKRLQDAVWELEETVSATEGERNQFLTQLEAVEAERDKLKDELKTAVALGDHLKHCYEQCEADRQALADERDKAKRDYASLAKSYNAVTGTLYQIHSMTVGWAPPESDEGRSDVPR